MPTTQVAFRFTDALIERVDAHVERMRTQTPGMDVTRADAVRVLLIQALDAAEATSEPKAKPKR